MSAAGQKTRHRELRWHGRLAAVAIVATGRILGATWRMRFEDPTHLFEGPDPQPVIYSIWHNRLALSMRAKRSYFFKRQPQRRLAALVSASRDGALLARTMEHFGVQPVRGSSSRRGAQALLELATWAERGYDIAITPDGPRGPRYRVQEGMVKLAQITGHPIVPVTARIHWKWCLKSWDRFQVPLPFTRCDMRIGSPLQIPPEANDDALETLRLDLENRMKELTED